MKQKAVVYTRVSTNKEIQQTSLKNQEEYYTDYCERRGYDLVKVYADEGLTGTNARREEFKQMLYDAGLDYTRIDDGYDSFSKSTRKPKYDILICKDISRFSRGSVQGQMIIKLLKDKNVNTVFDNAGISTFDENWSFNIGILFSIAENESAGMSKRIKFAKRHNVTKGKYAPARLPYGYIKNDKNEIIIHEEEAETVRYIFSRYLDVGGTVICKELNAKGIKSQTGKLWTDDKVTRIVHNRIYTGTAVVGKTFKSSVTDVKRSKSDKKEYLEIPNAVDPIISLEEYESANLVREKRMNKNKKVGRKPARNDKYYEKLFCSNCGSRFVRHIGNGNKISYMCQNRRKGLGCLVRGISIQNLDKNLDEVEIKYLSNTMADTVYYKELLRELENQKSQLNRIKKEVNQKIVLLNEEIDTITDQFLSLKDSDKIKERLIKRANDKELEINELNEKLKKLNIESISHIQEKVEEKKRMIELLTTANSLTQEDKLKLLNKVEVGDYELNFQFAIPTFEEEVNLYNKLFSMTPIDIAIPFSPFTETFKRTHKDAREFWESVNDV